MGYRSNTPGWSGCLAYRYIYIYMYADDWMMEDSDWECLDVSPPQQQDATGSNDSYAKEPEGEEEPERCPC